MAKMLDKTARRTTEFSLVREYFENKRKGYFVEVGANDPQHGSQTWHLEDGLQWSGVLVEPLPNLALRCRNERRRSQVFECACVENTNVEDIKFYIPLCTDTEDEIHCRSAAGKNVHDGKFKTHREIIVPARTLDSILEEASVSHIDLLSIDVEGTELEVLQGLDLQKYQPKLVLIEDKYLYLNKHRHLTKYGYRLVKRTTRNCWYVPKGAKRLQQSVIEKFILFKKMYITIWKRKFAYSIQHRTMRPFQQL